MIKKAVKILNEYFGYANFRSGQELIVDSVLKGKNTLGIMPTGGGKSLCYQIPALCFPDLTIVISPLISLMKDQIDFLHKINYPAHMLNSTISFSDQKEIMKRVEDRELKLLYLTPERFKNDSFLDWLCSIKISLFTIDEAHCISEWGHDFRPEYRKLKDVIKVLKNPVTLALTATATEEVRADIVSALDMEKPEVFVSGFNRENLIYGVQNHFSQEEKNKALIEFCNKISGSGIIYVSSIKDGEMLNLILKSYIKKRIGLYHGSLNSTERKIVQDNFLSNKIDILIATNAFGMGVNKPDIRYVVHYSIPGTIEAYYQETGRAGRDGKISYCLLLDFYEDQRIQNFFIESKNPSLDALEHVLENIKKYSKNKLLYNDDYSFLSSDEKKLSNFKIDAILKQLNFMEIINFDFITEEKAEIKLNSKKITDENDRIFIDELFSIEENSKSLSANIKFLSKRVDLMEKTLKKKLTELKEKKIIEFDIIKPGKIIRLLIDRITNKQKEEYIKKVKIKKEFDKKKFQAVVDYASLSAICRRKFLLNYFGEIFKEENCGKCDICRGTYTNYLKADFNDIQKTLIYFFLQNDGKIGKNKAIKILTGSYDLEDHYREWEDFGVLKTVNSTEINKDINLLIKRNILSIKEGKYPTVKLTNTGLSELKKIRKK